MSVSDNTIEGEQAEGAKSGGGTLQLWRISDLLYRPEEEVVKELEEHRCVPYDGGVCPLQKCMLLMSSGVQGILSYALEEFWCPCLV